MFLVYALFLILLSDISVAASGSTAQSGASTTAPIERLKIEKPSGDDEKDKNFVTLYAFDTFINILIKNPHACSDAKTCKIYAEKILSNTKATLSKFSHTARLPLENIKSEIDKKLTALEAQEPSSEEEGEESSVALQAKGLVLESVKTHMHGETLHKANEREKAYAASNETFGQLHHKLKEMEKTKANRAEKARLEKEKKEAEAQQAKEEEEKTASARKKKEEEEALEAKRLEEEKASATHQEEESRLEAERQAEHKAEAEPAAAPTATPSPAKVLAETDRVLAEAVKAGRGLERELRAEGVTQAAEAKAAEEEAIEEEREAPPTESREQALGDEEAPPEEEGEEPSADMGPPPMPSPMPMPVSGPMPGPDQGLPPLPMTGPTDDTQAMSARTSDRSPLILPRPRPRPITDRFNTTDWRNFSYQQRQQEEQRANEEDQTVSDDETQDILLYLYELLVRKGIQNADTCGVRSECQELYTNTILNVMPNLKRNGFSKQHSAFQLLYDLTQKIPNYTDLQRFNISKFIFSTLDEQWQKKFTDGYRVPLPSSDQDLQNLVHNPSGFTFSHWALILISAAEDTQYSSKSRQECLDAFFQSANDLMNRAAAQDLGEQQAALKAQNSKLLKSIQAAADAENPLPQILLLIKGAMSPQNQMVTQEILQRNGNSVTSKEAFNMLVQGSEKADVQWKKQQQGGTSYDTTLYKAAPQPQQQQQYQGDGSGGGQGGPSNQLQQGVEQLEGKALQGLEGALEKGLSQLFSGIGGGG